MLTIQPNEREEELAFVKRAAASFAANSQLATYSDKNPTASQLLALRWGLDNDGVLVVKLDADFVPANYVHIIAASAPSLDTPEWRREDQEGAMAEGWVLMNTPKVCCVNLYPHKGPTLNSVDDALYMVRTGTGEHHKRTRGLLSVRNPNQYERMQQVTEIRDDKA